MLIVGQPLACRAPFNLSDRSRTFFNSLREGTPSPSLPKVRCQALTRSVGGAFCSFFARSCSLRMRSISAFSMTLSPAQFVGSGSLACARVDAATTLIRRNTANETAITTGRTPQTTKCCATIPARSLRIMSNLRLALVVDVAGALPLASGRLVQGGWSTVFGALANG